MKKVTLAIDATLLNSIQSCPRRTELAHLRNKVLIDEKRTPLDAGSLFHLFMEEFNRYQFSHPNLCAPEVLHYIQDKLTTSIIEKNDLTLLPVDFYFIKDIFGEYAQEDKNYTIHSVPEETLARVMYEDETLRIIYAGKTCLLYTSPSPRD